MARGTARTAALTFALAAATITAGRAVAGEFPRPKVDFTADSVTTITNAQSQGKPMQIAGKMFQSGEKMRQEVSMNGMQNVVIQRRDKKLMWSLMPATKSYMEFSPDDPKLGKKADAFDNLWKNPEANLEKEGSEEVNGVSTTRNKVTINGADGKTFTGLVWLTKDDVPMRMKTSPAAGTEVLMELSNLKIGKQDAALFEIPEGYSKMQMPDLSGMAGAMGQQGGAPGQPGAAGKPPQMSPEQMKQLQDQIRKQMEQMQKNMPKAPPQAPPATAPTTP